ncbi:hypothetical protein D910_03856 [Dendroctonus ponderosae]
MNCVPIVLVLIVALASGQAKVIEKREVSEVSRRIHGSYGEFRDFTAADCSQPHENKWVKCASSGNPAFVYHWNNQLKGCERAIFKGCAPTRNNFVTEKDCNKQAKPVCS